MPAQKGFRANLAWNLTGFALIAMAGFGTTFVLGKVCGPELLGYFDQLYAIYVISSQMAVLSIHHSVAKHAAQYVLDELELKQVFSSGVLSALLISVPVAILLSLLAGPIASVLNNEAIREGTRTVALGLVMFALNKVYAGHMNGIRSMKWFAITGATRALGLFTIVTYLALKETPKEQFAWAFVLAEGLVFSLIVMRILFFDRMWGSRYVTRTWLRRHGYFGLQAFPSNVAGEANSRTDVLILGAFAPDSTVGIYSFVAMVMSGFSELGLVLTNTVAPAVTQAHYGSKNLLQTFRTAIRLTYAVFVPFGLVGIVVFPYLISVMGLDPQFHSGRGPFALYMCITLLVIGYTPFRNLFLQVGAPLKHTVLQVAAFLVNLMVCTVAIPQIELFGAALGGASANLFQLLVIRYIMRKWSLKNAKNPE